MKTLVLLGVVIGWAMTPSAAIAQHPASCGMVGLRVLATDSLAAEPPAAPCPHGRLVVAGTPRMVPSPTGRYQPVRQFDVDVAVENSGATSLRLPAATTGDSITAVQHGRQLSVAFSRPYHDMFTWYPTNVRPWTVGAGGGRMLAPGQRSAVQTLRVAVGPLAQGLRFWFTVDGVTDGPPPRYPSVRPSPRYDGVLPARVQRFVAAAGLGTVKDARIVFRLENHDLILFNVRFGPPLDCPAGCFWSSALGLQYGDAVGWLTMNDYSRPGGSDSHTIQRDSFPRSALDAYFLSPAFMDTLSHSYAHAEQSIVWTLRDYIVRDPRVPRATLVRHVEALYDEPGDWGFGKLLASLPRVRDDVELLTLLAYLPYDGGQGEAAYRLQTLAPQLVRDPSTPPRTLFLLAPAIRPDADSALFRRLVEHPHVRTNVAILAELAHHNAEMRGRLLAIVRASPRVRAELSDYFEPRSRDIDAARIGMDLLADPEAGANEDVLLVLANAEIGSALTYEVRSTATRRLPETALRRYGLTYHPIR